MLVVHQTSRGSWCDTQELPVPGGMTAGVFKGEESSEVLQVACPRLL